jgi:hypothetical protein
MKITITGGLIRNAIDLVRFSHIAHAKGNPDDEVRWSIGAHLMIAIALEGLANEVGETIVDTRTWKELRRASTPEKWRILSHFGGRVELDPKNEPLKSVSELMSLRHGIAHPKQLEGGQEVIVRSSVGRVQRNVPLDTRLEQGDTVFIALGELLDTYTSANAVNATQRALRAMKTLRDHFELANLDWIDDREKELQQLIEE